MASKKRIIIASLFGFIFGVVCYSLAKSGNSNLPVSIAWSIVIGRTLIGFAIGISALFFYHWSINGLVYGFIFSLPGALGAMSAGNPNFTPIKMLIVTIIMGMVYGFLIEFFTTIIFKAPKK